MANLRNTFHESRLYHGTDQPNLQPGETILPANQAGVDASSDESVAYATPDIKTAKFMAWERNNFTGANFEGPEDSKEEHVYRVEPIDPKKTERNPIDGGDFSAPRIDTEGFSKDSDEVTSPAGFRVLSKVQNPAAIIQKIQNIQGANGKKAEREGRVFSAGDRELLSGVDAEETKEWKSNRARKRQLEKVSKKKANKVRGVLTTKAISSGRNATAGNTSHS